MSTVTLWARHWDREYCCIVLNVECAKGVVAVVASEIYITSDHKFDVLIIFLCLVVKKATSL